MLFLVVLCSYHDATVWFYEFDKAAVISQFPIKTIIWLLIIMTVQSGNNRKLRLCPAQKDTALSHSRKNLLNDTTWGCQVVITIETNSCYCYSNFEWPQENWGKGERSNMDCSFTVTQCAVILHTFRDNFTTL